MKIGFTHEKLTLNLKPDILKLLSSLKPGQTVNARVISQDQTGQVLIDIMGSKMRVELGKPVKQGDQLVFEVVKDQGSKDAPSLKLIDTLPAGLSRKQADSDVHDNLSKITSSPQTDLKPSAQIKGAVVKAVLGKLPSFIAEKTEENNEGLQRPASTLENQVSPKKSAFTFPARVLKGLDNGRVVFSIKGEEIPAKVSSNIPEGRVVFLEKVKPGPSTEFRVIQPDIAQSIRSLAASVQTEGGAGIFPKLISMMSKILQNVKPDSDGVRHLPEPRLEKLMQIMEKLSLSSDVPKPDFVNKLVDEGGLSWENKIVSTEGNPEALAELASSKDDIKGLILDLLSDSKSLSPDIGKTLEHALSSLENLQIMNRTSSSEAGIFFLPFPILFEGSFSFGQIFFDMPEKSQAENSERPYRVSIILNMTELGKIRTDVSFLRKKISGTVIVSSEEVQKLIQENIKDLEKSLLSRGFDAADIGVRMPRTTSELDSSSVFSGMIEKNDGLSILV